MKKRRYAEILLLSVGACFLAKGAWDLLSYSAFEAHPQWFSKPASLAGFPNDGALLPVSLTGWHPLENLRNVHVLGKLEVPRLGMSVLVVEGDDPAKLGLAAGHMTGSASFGERGNAVVAGHRDTAFWPLRGIRVGDRVRVRGAKTYNYVVTSVRIVSPEDVSVLKSDDTRELTLITCYPFRYIGSAPQRLIIQATIPRS